MSVKFFSPLSALGSLVAGHPNKCQAVRVTFRQILAYLRHTGFGTNVDVPNAGKLVSEIHRGNLQWLLPDLQQFKACRHE